MPVRALNAGRLPRGVVPEEDLLVVAGRSTEATWAEVERASDLGAPAGVRDLGPLDVVAFARLRSALRYAVPFDLHPEPIRFGSARTAVRAYGCSQGASRADDERMREQVDVHLPEVAQDEDENLAHHVVVVLKALDGERVVLSGRPARETLAATWLDARRVVESTPALNLQVMDELAIPRVSIRTGRSYDEIAPAPIPSIEGGLVLARQDVSLTVDERGADVDAEALGIVTTSTPLVVRYERPFLLALVAAGSRDPYVVAWIGSDDALHRQDEPIGRPPDTAELRALEGTWRLDLQRTVQAAVEHKRRTWRLRGGELEAAARDLARRYGARAFQITVRPDATVSVASAESSREAGTVEGYLARDGARVLLVHPAAGPPGRPNGAEGESRWTVTREGGQLVLRAQPAGETLFLVR